MHFIVSKVTENVIKVQLVSTVRPQQFSVVHIATMWR